MLWYNKSANEFGFATLMAAIPQSVGGFFFRRALLRRMTMNEKLYVGNLSYQTTADELRQLFSQAGTVSACDLITDRDTGQSKGFAFVTMSTQAEAEKATSMFNAYSLGSRPLTVNTAKPREARSGGGGGGSRGGSRGGGGYRN
jgi:RNA recognition motif-containing protein